MKPKDRFIKARTEQLVEAVGGLAPAALYSRVGTTELQKYYSPAHPNRFMPIDVVVDLETVAADRDGAPHLIGPICNMLGGVFVPVPQVEVSRGDLLGSVGRIAKETADVTQAICTALSDGEIREREIDGARVQIAEAMTMLATLDSQLLTMRGDA